MIEKKLNLKLKCDPLFFPCSLPQSTYSWLHAFTSHSKKFQRSPRTQRKSAGDKICLFPNHSPDQNNSKVSKQISIWRVTTASDSTELLWKSTRVKLLQVNEQALIQTKYSGVVISPGVLMYVWWQLILMCETIHSSDCRFADPCLRTVTASLSSLCGAFLC